MRGILIIVTFFMMLCASSCSNSSTITESPTETLPPVEHKYFEIGNEIDAGDFLYTVHSVKEGTSIPVKEGTKWLVVDLTMEDTLGDEDGYQAAAYLYGDFILLDDEKNIYRSYNKENKVAFYDSVRDVVLFNVPASKKDFLLFDNSYMFEELSDLDIYSYNFVKFSLEADQH